MENRKYYYLKILFLIIYFADALYYSYTSLFLSSLGFKEGVIGTIASITTITYLIANPIWNIFAKDNKRIKYMMMVIALLSGVVIILYGNVSGIELIMVLTALLASIIAPFYTLLDSHSIKFCKKYDKEYSNVRVMGSTAYIFGNAIGGLLIDFLGYSNVFFISGSIFIIAGILILFLKPIDGDAVEEKKKRDFKAIFKNKWFWGYILCYLFLVTLNFIGDGFVPLLFYKIKNVSTSNYGFIAAGVILVEVMTMLILAKFLKKYRDIYLYLFAGVSYFMRAFLLSFTGLPLWILIVAACLRGVAWGSILFVHMKYLVKLVGIENVTSAALLLVTFTSLFQFVGSNLFGYLFEHVGYDFSFRLIGVLSLSVCLIFVGCRLIYEKKLDDSYRQNS